MKPTFTALSHPKLFAACLTVLHDNGIINRMEPAPTVIGDDLTISLTPTDLFNMENALSSLSDADIETLCIGEQSESDLIMRTGHPSLAHVVDLLNDLILC